MATVVDGELQRALVSVVHNDHSYRLQLESGIGCNILGEYNNCALKDHIQRQDIYIIRKCSQAHILCRSVCLALIMTRYCIPGKSVSETRVDSGNEALVSCRMRLNDICADERPFNDALPAEENALLTKARCILCAKTKIQLLISACYHWSNVKVSCSLSSDISKMRFPTPAPTGVSSPPTTAPTIAVTAASMFSRLQAATGASKARLIICRTAIDKVCYHVWGSTCDHCVGQPYNQGVVATLCGGKILIHQACRFHTNTIPKTVLTDSSNRTSNDDDDDDAHVPTSVPTFAPSMVPTRTPTPVTKAPTASPTFSRNDYVQQWQKQAKIKNSQQQGSTNSWHNAKFDVKLLYKNELKPVRVTHENKKHANI